MYGSQFGPLIHILKTLSGYPFFNAELKLGKSNKSNNPGMEVQFKRAFKTVIFCHQKKEYKSRHPTKNFIQPLIQVCNSYVNPLFQTQHSLYSVALCFPKNISTPRSGSTKW